MKPILPDWARWIARDKYNELWVYENKPKKLIFLWNVESGTREPVNDPSNYYSFIKWEDEEPWSVADSAFHIASESTAKALGNFGKAFNTTEEDIINKPNHYHSNGVDVICFSEAQFSKEQLKGFYRINAIKYITRYDRKKWCGGFEEG